MLRSKARQFGTWVFILIGLTVLASGMPQAWAQGTPGANTPAASTVRHSTAQMTAKDVGNAGNAGTTGDTEEKRGTFDADHGTWLNPLVRKIFGLGPVTKTKSGEYINIKYDFIVVSLLTMLGLAVVGVTAARKMQLRPDGKPTALPNLVEAAVDGYRDYLVSVMGQPLAYKYTPLIASFFFCILVFNWLGLIPGLVAPTANPHIPITMAICAFFCVHFIAIREAGIKSWFMHFVGEPLWLAPLNFPLHIIGELIKPMSLSVRLLCNVFGEEMVALQLSLLAVAAMSIIKFPIPFQLPMLLLGVFFGALQALVFSTLLAIYISILATHHDDHDVHNEHGHIESVRTQGRHELVAHPSETPVA